MYSTTAYLYQQKQQVIILDTSGAYYDRRWQPVYTKELKINRGVDNVILFEFINQDQKPVNISGMTLVFHLMDQDNDRILISRDFVHLNSTYGRAKVTFTAEELDSIAPQHARFGIRKTSGNLTEAVYVDDYANSSGVVDIIDGVYPKFVDSEIMTVPDFSAKQKDNPNRNHTSAIYTADRDFTTFQLFFNNFTGNVKAQASVSQLGPWNDIGSQTVYTNKDGSDYINVVGNHEYLRFEINQYGIGATATATVSDGAVTNVAVQGGGTEYLGASADVHINGLGTGAVATASTTSESVTDITVTNSGSGYVVAPTVKIDLGEITAIVYR